MMDDIKTQKKKSLQKEILNHFVKPVDLLPTS